MSIRIFFFASLLIPTAVSAQAYKTAAGLRMGSGFHVSVKQQLADRWTGEVLLTPNWSPTGPGVTMMGAYNRKVLFRGIGLFYGGGGHYYWDYTPARDERTERTQVYGLTLIGGMELTMKRLNISLDLKPEVHIGGTSKSLRWQGPSVTARYVLVRPPKPIKKSLLSKIGLKKK
jgi:hypothetical protein